MDDVSDILDTFSSKLTMTEKYNINPAIVSNKKPRSKSAYNFQRSNNNLAGVIDFDRYINKYKRLQAKWCKKEEEEYIEPNFLLEKHFSKASAVSDQSNTPVSKRALSPDLNTLLQEMDDIDSLEIEDEFSGRYINPNDIEKSMSENINVNTNQDIYLMKSMLKKVGWSKGKASNYGNTSNSKLDTKNTPPELKSTNEKKSISYKPLQTDRKIFEKCTDNNKDRSKLKWEKTEEPTDKQGVKQTPNGDNTYLEDKNFSNYPQPVGFISLAKNYQNQNNLPTPPPTPSETITTHGKLVPTTHQVNPMRVAGLIKRRAKKEKVRKVFHVKPEIIQMVETMNCMVDINFMWPSSPVTKLLIVRRLFNRVINQRQLKRRQSQQCEIVPMQARLSLNDKSESCTTSPPLGEIAETKVERNARTINEKYKLKHIPAVPTIRTQHQLTKISEKTEEYLVKLMRSLTYAQAVTVGMSKVVCAIIRDQLKIILSNKNYRFVVHTTLMQANSQSCHIVSRCLANRETDSFLWRHYRAHDCVTIVVVYWLLNNN